MKKLLFLFSLLFIIIACEKQDNSPIHTYKVDCCWVYTNLETNAVKKECGDYTYYTVSENEMKRLAELNTHQPTIDGNIKKQFIMFYEIVE